MRIVLCLADRPDVLSVGAGAEDRDEHATRSPRGCSGSRTRKRSRTLLLDYGRHLDSRDFAAYSALFAKDGEWSRRLRHGRRGPADIKAFMEKDMGTQPNAPRTITCSRTSSSP